MAEEKKDVLLRQGNPLTESRYKFSNYEKNAFYVVVKQVRRDYVERTTSHRVREHESKDTQIRIERDRR